MYIQWGNHFEINPTLTYRTWYIWESAPITSNSYRSEISVCPSFIRDNTAAIQVTSSFVHHYHVKDVWASWDVCVHLSVVLIFNLPWILQSVRHHPEIPALQIHNLNTSVRQSYFETLQTLALLQTHKKNVRQWNHTIMDSMGCSKLPSMHRCWTKSQNYSRTSLCWVA